MKVLVHHDEYEPLLLPYGEYEPSKEDMEWTNLLTLFFRFDDGTTILFPQQVFKVTQDDGRVRIQDYPPGEHPYANLPPLDPR